MSTVQLHHDHPVVRNTTRGIVTVAGGFVALGLTFVTYAGWQSAFRSLFFHGDVAQWQLALERGLFVLLVAAVTWYLMRRWPTALGTAVWLAVPTSVALVFLGVWAWPATWLGIVIGGALVVGVDAVLLMTGRPWEQVLSITWIALLLLVTVLTGTEI
jgi:hypothetical protein